MDKHVTILGGGPAGLATAYFAKKHSIDYDLYELKDQFGGNCVTIKHKGHLFDSGAHRLHDVNKDVTEVYKDLLGENLVRIEVPSQIYRDGFYIDFPISPFNLIKYLGIFPFILESFKLLFSRLAKPGSYYNNFEDFAVRKYGKKISKLFLIEYSEKLWGLKAKDLSVKISGKRLKGLNIYTLILEFFFKNKVKTKHLDGAFFYPKFGIGMLADSFVRKLNTENLHSNSKITSIEHSENKIVSIQVNSSKKISVNNLVSSLPINVFINSLSPQPPKEIIDVANNIKFRDLILVAIFLNVDRVNTNGSMYFPSSKFCFTRVYEPKNRSSYMSPKHMTSLIVEIPCYKESDFWMMDDDYLSDLIITDLCDISIISKESVESFKIFKIPNAYPILEKDFDLKTTKLFNYLKSFKNLKLIGRNGLFQYSHIHDQIISASNVVKSL